MTPRKLSFILPISALVFSSCAEISSEPSASSEILDAERTSAAENQASSTVTAAPVTPGNVTRMPLGTFFQLQQTDGALIYDVRPSFFYGLGHIPGAISWPKGAFDSQIASREPEIRKCNASGRPVVIYCTDLQCPDARTVAGKLSTRGLETNVLEGGWEAWKAGSLPTE